ncbi:MAG: DUF1353 domain-containing protein [Luteolibacter sp.]
MKTVIHPVLITCLFLCGCIPSGTVSHPSSHIRQEVSSPDPKRPEAPVLKRLSNGHYRLRKPWTVDLNGRRWLIPAGYKTNGITASASMKKSLGDGVDHPETWAAIFHDWLFTQPGISRSQADGMFYDLMIAYGVPTPRAKIMYAAVRLYSLSKSFR